MKEPAVLVVDDNTDHLELTVLALSECCEAGEVLALADSQEALDFLFAQGRHAGRASRRLPRLVILDMKLLPLSGLQVLRAIRTDPRTARLPVVMHSSSIEKTDIAACYAAGANSYIGKASNYDELCRRMRQVYEFWVLVNEG